MKSSRLFMIAIIVLSGVLVSFTNSWSSTFEFHPRFTLGEEYNDNIDLDDKNTESDWITTVAPGFSLTYDARSLDAVVDYTLDLQFYAKHSSNDQDSIRDGSRGSAMLSFFSGRPFTLLVSSTVTSTALNERDNSTEYNDSENRSTLYTTTVAPQYRWQLTQTFSLVFGYTYHREDYVETSGDDNYEHVGDVSLVKQVSSSTDVFVRYTYTDYNTDFNGDGDNQDGDEYGDYAQQDYTVGINQQVSSRISGSIEGGYTQIDYKSGSNTGNPTIAMDASYRYSAPVTFTLGYSYDYEDTPEEGLTERHDAYFGVNYARESLSASTELFWYESKYESENRKDEGFGIRFDLSKPLSRVLTANFNTDYGHGKYTDPSEKVDEYGMGASLDYTYRRFLVSLGYIFRYSDSDISYNDYTNNVVMLTGTVNF